MLQHLPRSVGFEVDAVRTLYAMQLNLPFGRHVAERQPIVAAVECFHWILSAARIVDWPSISQLLAVPVRHGLM